MLATVRRDYSKKPLLVAVFVMTVAFLLYMMSHSIASALLSISGKLPALAKKNVSYQLQQKT